MDKKTILMLGWEYPPHNSGGLGVACQGMVEALIDQGQKVILALPSPSSPKEGEWVTYKTLKNLRPYKVLMVYSTMRPYTKNEAVGFEGDLVSQANDYARLIVSALKDTEFDVVHCHDWLTVPAAVALKNAFHKKTIMHVHSTEFDRTGGGEPNLAVAKIEGNGFQESDLILTVSKYTKKLLVEKYHVSEQKVRVVHNGNNYFPNNEKVDIDFLKNSPVILFVGRLTIQKGPEQFLELAKNVINQIPESVFVFAGDGDMYQHLLLTSAYHQLSGHVLFAGFLRDRAKDRLYHRADVFVMPSLSEPFGIVALEAAAFGVPVVVSKTSGVAEVLPSAVAIDFWDIDKMSKVIVEMVSKKMKIGELGERLKKESGQVSWDLAANKLREEYQRLLLPVYG